MSVEELSKVVDGVWPLTGRDRELDAIGAEPTGAGRGGVVLAGAAGVGKTRLAREGLSRLAAAGWSVEWAAATRAAAAIPFGALSQLLPAEGQLDQSRFAVLRRVAERFAGPDHTPRPAAVAVDDAHLLDEASAALVHHLATRRLVFPLITLRAGARAPDAVMALWKEGFARRVEVAPLPVADVDRLLDHVFDGRLDAVSRQDLRTVSAGNPLLLREVLRAGLDTGRLRFTDGVWRWTGQVEVTNRLAEIVAARLGNVDPAVHAVLEIVACGEPLPVAILERLAEHDCVVAAQRHGLVRTERSGSREVARLAHPLYAEVIRGTMAASRARAVSRSLAGALTATPMRRREDMLVAGVWQVRSGHAGDPEVLTAAAREATARFDLDLAESLARAARAAGGGWHADQALVEVLDHRGRYEEAASALPGAPATGAGDEHTRWATTRAAILYWGQHRRAEAERVLDEAAGDAAEHPAQALRCWILLFDGQCREALRVGRRVLAAPSADPSAVVWASAGVTAAAGLLGQADLAAATWSDGLAVAGRHRHDLPWARAQVGFAACLALLVAGDVRAAAALADQEYRAAAEQRAIEAAGGWAVLRGIVAKFQGQVGTAVSTLREGVVLLDGNDAYRLAGPCLAALAGASALAGDAREAARWLERADGCAPGTGRLLHAWTELDRAWTNAATGDTRTAARLARGAADLAGMTEQPAFEAIALYDAARLGDAAAVLRRLGGLASRLGGSLAPVLARAAVALSRGDGDGLDRVSVAFGGLGLSVHATETALAAARLHLRARRYDRATRSRERAARFVADCPGAHTPLLDLADVSTTLTRREREVVRLAVARHTSRQIAELLRLSVRTVDNYLGRVYAKLGVSGRADLVELLMPPDAHMER